MGTSVQAQAVLGAPRMWGQPGEGVPHWGYCGAFPCKLKVGAQGGEGGQELTPMPQCFQHASPILEASMVYADLTLCSPRAK